MIAYIVRRLFSTIVVMAVVAFVVFSLLYLTPGDPAAVIAGDIATDEDIRRIHARLGLDDPFLVQFGRWLWSLAHGDLGTSIFTNLPVTQLIGQRVKPTVSLTLRTLVVAILVAVPLVVVAAARAVTCLDLAVVTSIGVVVRLLFGAAIVRGMVFGLPGIGRLTVDAILCRDYPIIQGVFLIFSAVYVLVNLAVDLSYVLFDPRIRY